MASEGNLLRLGADQDAVRVYSADRTIAVNVIVTLGPHITIGRYPEW